MWKILAPIVAWIIIVIFSPINSNLEKLKVKYWSTLDMLRATGDPVWHPVLKPAILTGIFGKRDGVIGSNINKGYEIYICLDGDDINSATYVLLHELAHMTVEEYDHSDKFWENFKNLKELAVKNGIYVKNGKKNYCGDVINDP